MIDTVSYEHPLDALVMAAAADDWRSITTVMSSVFDDAGFDKESYSAQDVAERVYVLVDNGRLDVSGNMRRWREGKVRLPSRK